MWFYRGGGFELGFDRWVGVFCVDSGVGEEEGVFWVEGSVCV